MAQHGIVFLMYHELELPGRPLSQSEAGYVRYALPQETFRSQMKCLKENNWCGLCVGEALNHSDGNFAAITFDDGSETDLIIAADILKEKEFNATFYVTAGRIGSPGYLAPAQLSQLHALGFEIGCHSMTHAYLNDVGASDLRREVWEAKERIEEMLGTRVEHFSCPGGRYDERTIAMAKEAGYRTLATSRAHVNLPSTDRFSLGRVAILRGIDDATFADICNGEGLSKIRLLDSVRGGVRSLFGNSFYDRLRSLMLHER
jgi:peptidoglycan/xylan/chitin deacetylase (PgdA/CDA1 family)